MCRVRIDVKRFYFLSQVLEISIVYEICDELESPEVECVYPPNPPPKPALGSAPQSGSIGSYSSNASDGKVRISRQRQKNSTLSTDLAIKEAATAALFRKVAGIKKIGVLRTPYPPPEIAQHLCRILLRFMSY